MNWTVIYKDQVSSLMDEMKKLGEDGSPEGTVMCAQSQSCGRGRQGRVWSSPEGGLYFAVLLRPQWDMSRISLVTLLSAVAVCEAIINYTEIHVTIKWPNDLLLEGRKLAGILVESQIKGRAVDFVVVGIGINVNSDLQDLPEEGVSLRHISAQQYDFKNLLDSILERFEFWYDQCGDLGFQDLINRWKQLGETLGQRVQYDDGQGKVAGEAFDLAEDGSLMIRCDDGRIVCKSSGEIKRPV